MNKKTVISATPNTMRKLKVLVKEQRKGLTNKMEVTAKNLGLKARKSAVAADKGADIYKNKKTVTSVTSNAILKLKVLAKKKEGTRGKLAVTAKKLATTAKEKEGVRSRLAIIAKKLAITAKEKESVRDKLVITAKKLAITAKEKESIRGRLEITAKQLATTAEEKEEVRSRLAVTAKQLATTAEEKEDTRSRLAVTAKQLATTAEEKEEVRRKLEITARQLATTAKEKESVRSRLAVTAKNLDSKAKQLATTAKEKESIRGKLEIIAEKLAKTAKEKEDTRRRLAVTAKNLNIKAKQLAKTAEEKEYVRGKLAVTAKQLAATADEKEDVRSRLAVIAEKLAATAKEKESVRRRLAVTAKNLDSKAKQLAATAKEKEEARSNLAVTAKQLAATAREVELANQQLRSLDLAKDEFVSIASHQLRTPLTSLKGYAGMLLDGDAGPINDKQREYLAEIKKANDRMIHLIMALLNVSRVDLDVFVVEPKLVNLEKVAESILKESEIRIKDKNLAITTHFEKDLPVISADLNIVRMILQNLLSNAVKYTPSGGKITLTLKKDGKNILISVVDNGYGIPKNVQSKIFTKMFRADNARVKDPDGTGLGLYIIKETIEKTGGKIWFESPGENKGSTFYVTIPLEGMKKKEGTKRLESK